MSADFKKRPEILAPAGSIEKLKVAIAYGADAIYLASKRYGLRAFSDNFDLEEMEAAVRFAHAHHVRCYVTVNILAHPEDFVGLEKMLDFYRSIGVDALIVADPGMFDVIRSCVPSVDIHISTQASVTNAKACQFWHKQGARRIVLARELTLEQIIDIRKEVSPKLELECFVHGAMCVAYSGRCLLSDAFLRRSANHGACAQPCRWSYQLIEDKRPGQVLTAQQDEHGTYVLSSKDLCMIEHIPALIEAGVDSFKIEGRMKGVFYVAATTKAYKEAVCRYANNPATYCLDTRAKALLEQTVHRNFDTGFFFDKPSKHAQIFSEKTYCRPAFVAALVRKVALDGTWGEIEQKNKIRIGDRLSCLSPDGYPDSFVVDAILDAEKRPVDSTPQAGATYYIRWPKEQPAGSFLYRLGKKDNE